MGNTNNAYSNSAEHTLHPKQRMKLNHCLNLISFTKNRLYIVMMFFISLTTQIYANELKVGFAELPITPDLIDEWEDINNDAQFDPDIDKWTDVNGNNQFDAVWMAGFQNKRAAQGFKDDLMAVTVLIDDGKTRIAIISDDTI